MVASGHRIAQLGHPLALQGEHRSGLGTGWNLQRLLAVHRFHLNGVAQNGLEVIERHLRVDVDAIAAQAGSRLNAQEHIEIAGGTTPLAGIALICHPQPGAGINPSWDVDAQFLTHLLQTLATAGAAGVGNHLAAALTGGTSRHLGKTAKWGASGPTHLAGAATGAAACGSTARLGTGPLAGAAGFEMANLHLLLDTKHRLLEVDGEVEA